MKILLPYGSFQLKDCFGKTRWYPNNMLDMSPEKQFSHNVKHGIFDNMDIVSRHGCYDGLNKETKCFLEWIG